MQLVQKNQSGGSGVAEKHVKQTYNAPGQTQKVTRYSNAAGTTEVGHSDYEYDKFGRLKGLDHELPNSTLITGYDWSFDNLNRVTLFDFIPAGYASEDVSTYSYDATDQLTVIDRASGTDESYVNDLNGNRRMSGTTNWVVNPDNRLFRDVTYEYTYDKEGNITKRVTLVSGSPTGATTEYTFDHRNRLAQITEKATPGGSATKITKYGYDAFDLRVFKNVDTDANGTSNRYEFYVWDGDDIIFDFVDADGGASPSATLAKRYLWGQAVDQILAEETIGGSTAWDLPDNLGSVRDLSDGTGALVSGSHVDYNAFGKIVSGTLGTRFAYTAQEYDADAGMYYYNARWYNPAIGRFVSVDPMGFGAGDTNLSRYVGNSPTNALDPSGLWKIVRDNTNPLAVATSERGDTIKTLARKIGLHVAEWPKWLTTPRPIKLGGAASGVTIVLDELNVHLEEWNDAELCPGQEFKVPNLIMSLWFGDVGAIGRTTAFDPYVQHFKELGFAVDIFEADAPTVSWKGNYEEIVLNAVAAKTKSKALQGIFAVGHGSAKAMGTRDYYWNWNPHPVEIKYADLARRLEYKLGVVILWVCYGGGADGKSLSSQYGDYVFDGVDRTLVPFFDYPMMDALFSRGKQGTRDLVGEFFNRLQGVK